MNPFPALEKELAKAARHRDALKKTHTASVTALQKADSVLQAAVRRNDGDEAEVRRAEDRVRDKPVPRNVRALTVAKERAVASKLCCDRPREVFMAREREEDAQAKALLSAEQEVERVQECIRIEEQRIVASLEDYEARTAAAYARVRVLLEEIDQLGTSILEDWRRSVAAAADCGEAPIAPDWIAMPLVRSEVERDPSILGAMLNPFVERLYHSGTVLTVRTFINMLARIRSWSGSANPPTAEHLAKWEAMQTARTGPEIWQILNPPVPCPMPEVKPAPPARLTDRPRGGTGTTVVM